MSTAEKLKDQAEIANTFNNLFIKITGKIKYATSRDRRRYINSKRSISWKPPPT
jgi:hypothetical protein